MSRPKKRKAGRKTLLTPETQAKIVSYVRAGAYDWVAAQAAGISTATFYRWMEGKTPEHAEFRDAVLEARAQARIAAEIQVRKEKPEVWLMRGPGRERPGEPGWGERVEVSAEIKHDIEGARESLAARIAALADSGAKGSGS